MAVPNFFRRPYGPGWALVGDAGYLKDFITAQGIQDAFRDAELCAQALDQTFTGRRTFDTAMKDYQESRDTQVMPMYEFTAQLASLDPPPPEMQQLLGAVSRSRPARTGSPGWRRGSPRPRSSSRTTAWTGSWARRFRAGDRGVRICCVYGSGIRRLSRGCRSGPWSTSGVGGLASRRGTARRTRGLRTP